MPNMVRDGMVEQDRSYTRDKVRPTDELTEIRWLTCHVAKSKYVFAISVPLQKFVSYTLRPFRVSIPLAYPSKKQRSVGVELNGGTMSVRGAKNEVTGI